MSSDEVRRAFRDARRSYLFAGGVRAGKLAPLLDPDFDVLPATPYQFENCGPLDIVSVFELTANSD